MLMMKIYKITTLLWRTWKGIYGKCLCIILLALAHIWVLKLPSELSRLLMAWNLWFNVKAQKLSIQLNHQGMSIKAYLTGNFSLTHFRRLISDYVDDVWHRNLPSLTSKSTYIHPHATAPITKNFRSETREVNLQMKTLLSRLCFE